MRIEKPIVDEALAELEEVSKLAVGTDAQERALKSATVIMDRAIKIEEINLEKRKIENEERKLDIEEARLEVDKKDRLRKDKIALGTSLLTFGGAVVIALKSFDFDGEKVFTSTIGKQVVSKWALKLFK